MLASILYIAKDDLKLLILLFLLNVCATMPNQAYSYKTAYL